MREDRALSRVFTAPMSAFFEDYFTARNVRIIKKERLTALEGKDSVEAVVLTSGLRKPRLDFAVAGVGAAPVTEFLASSGLTLGNGVIVNEYLETDHPGISAAGDIASYVDKIFNKRRRVEHLGQRRLAGTRLGPASCWASASPSYTSPIFLRHV